MDGVSGVWPGRRDRNGAEHARITLDTAFRASNPVLF
jgi:hypothetical protein